VQLPAVRETGEGRLEVDGSVPLKELNAEHELGLPESPDYVTIAGLLLERLGHIPEAGATVLVPPHRLTVLNMDGRRVARLLVERLPEEPQAEAVPEGA
jgi:CBS domain containing-hemolysin-like protein